MACLSCILFLKLGLGLALTRPGRAILIGFSKKPDCKVMTEKGSYHNPNLVHSCWKVTNLILQTSKI